MLAGILSRIEWFIGTEQVSLWSSKQYEFDLLNEKKQEIEQKIYDVCLQKVELKVKSIVEPSNPVKEQLDPEIEKVLQIFHGKIIEEHKE